MAAEDKNTELHHIQNKIKAIANNLFGLKKRKNQTSLALKQVEKKQGDIAHTIRQLNHQVQETKQRIADIQQEVQIQNGWLLMQQQQLAQQVRSAHALGQQEQLKLFFNQQDSHRTSRIITYYRYFNQTRLDQLAHINTSLQLLSSLDAEKKLESQKLEILIINHEQQKEQLAKSKKERKKILAKIKKSYQRNSLKLSLLKKNEEQLKGMIQTLKQTFKEVKPPTKNKKSFQSLKNKLSWPVQGKITHTFHSPRPGGKWDGVLIKAKEGTKIQAIARGQVIFSDWFKGSGFLVIVKHDNKYMSLYAFNQSLYQEKGAWVEAGDTLATVGNSGGREQAGLYFQIRKKGKAINPKKWCKKKH